LKDIDCVKLALKCHDHFINDQRVDVKTALSVKEMKKLVKKQRKKLMQQLRAKEPVYQEAAKSDQKSSVFGKIEAPAMQKPQTAQDSQSEQLQDSSDIRMKDKSDP